ncbi:DUF4143 domain-containing protein [Bifidobacterium gallicum]|uniref:ATPase n=1 Tax=Bifidobacterium gallicum DSM 20093 = LMG 11596 TaxID=561180 RepID=D1NW98_9BIFI|nr:hypothetical protein BIFGAL_04145 [Bifidobacterium gallicum DSM 20093 = LMG 11596]KFI60086.1 ATPase [Bifidobacterium gallicum DSM 20093 = LMG 11596]
MNQQTNDTTAPLMARDGGAFFKVYLADTGLLFHKYGLDSSAWLTAEGRNRLSVRFRGALTENYAMQALIANNRPIFLLLVIAGRTI